LEEDGTKIWNKRRGRRKAAFGRAVESFVCGSNIGWSWRKEDLSS